jgi:FkbH-like protein
MNATTVDRVKVLLEQDRHPEALRVLFEQVRATSDYGTYMKMCRWRQRIGEIATPVGATRLRIALLGGVTTDFLKQPLELELESFGLQAELFASDYGTYVHELLDADSATTEFAPDIAIVLVNYFNITDWPSVGDAPGRVDSLVERVCESWLGACETFHARTDSEIILSNLHLLPVRDSGNLGCRLVWDPNRFLRQVNVALSRKAPPYVHLLDVEMLSSIYGIDNWFDVRFWHHSKQPVSFACLIPFVRNVSGMVAALRGRTAKCVVLDLDNTIWGGVVGDDGIEGLKIGEGDAESEAFKGFQRYLLSLKQRGILLAVSSKNEYANALAPFEKLTEMVLKREDFVAFKAGWGPKPDALREIASELNIGLDALVFVDDNPAERELVRQSLPQVKVVELSGDPAEYPMLLDRSGWLETIRITDEDRKKTDQYRDNIERNALQDQHVSYEAYLRSLNQRATIRAFDFEHLDRIAQLINKTNQFNLTTRRTSRSEVESLLDRADVVTAYVRLSDRFGDNGIISVFYGHLEGNSLVIDQWLMSCRVFKRGVEYLLARHVIDRARSLGVESVRGTYIPTDKNTIVKEFYADLGFKQDKTQQDGTTTWILKPDDFKSVTVYIAETEDTQK